MIPEEIEACAKRAYETFALMVNEPTPWDGLSTQHHWRDLVTTRLNNPDAGVANIQEDCVKQAVEKALESMTVAEDIGAPVSEEAIEEVEEAALPKKKKGAK